MNKLKRIFLLPFGFIKKVLEIANEGARDIENKLRFKNATIDKGCCMNDKSILHENVHLLENCIINNSVMPNTNNTTRPYNHLNPTWSLLILSFP
jgi:hypothetical protein